MYRQTIPYFLSLALFACAPNSGLGDPDCTSCDVLDDQEIIRGADVEWARCWVDHNIDGSTDPFFERDQISCSLGERESSFAPYRINLTFTDAAGNIEAMWLPPDLLEDSLTVLANDEGTYPIVVGMSIELGTEAVTGRHLKHEFVIEKGSLAYETPQLVTQPFDLWPVTVRDEGLDRFWLMADYDIELAPNFRAGEANTSFSAMSTTLSVDYNESAASGELLRVQIPVPQGDENYFLDSRYRTRQGSTINEGTVSIDQPGSFVATEAGVQLDR